MTIALTAAFLAALSYAVVSRMAAARDRRRAERLHDRLWTARCLITRMDLALTSADSGYYATADEWDHAERIPSQDAARMFKEGSPHDWFINIL